MIEEFRTELANYRQSVHNEARSLKLPHIAFERIVELYKKFDHQERQMADAVLSEWVLSEDEVLRFDALALVNDLMITTSRPSLEKLLARLEQSSAVSAPFEVKKVQRILAGFDAIGWNT